MKYHVLEFDLTHCYSAETVNRLSLFVEIPDPLESGWYVIDPENEGFYLGVCNANRMSIGEFKRVAFAFAIECLKEDIKLKQEIIEGISKQLADLQIDIE